MITLDGVMQAPGGPEEDKSDDFNYGGWVAPYFDEEYGNVMQKQMYPADLLLGRKTFDIFEDYWPKHESDWPGVNDVTKYVLSTTRSTSHWTNTVFLDSINGIRELKKSEGRDIQVHGSGEVARLLLKNDLVDELWMKFHPLTLGKGKRFFEDEAIPVAFKLLETHVTPSGVLIANYKRDGEVKTGTVGEP